MVYSTYRGDGARVVTRDVTRSMTILRSATGRPDVPVHLIGGLGDEFSRAEARAFARNVATLGPIGWGLYDFSVTAPSAWAALRALGLASHPVATGTEVHEVALPAGAEPPFRVYVNGEERAEGAGFIVEGGTLRFTPPLHAQPPIGLGRKILLGIGIGVYGDLKGDTLDLQYHAAGQARVATIPLTPAGKGTPGEGEHVAAPVPGGRPPCSASAPVRMCSDVPSASAMAPPIDRAAKRGATRSGRRRPGSAQRAATTSSWVGAGSSAAV